MLCSGYVTVCVIQWIEVLDAVHEVISWCGLAWVDAPLAAEVSLRLALAHESCAFLHTAPLPTAGGE